MTRVALSLTLSLGMGLFAGCGQQGGVVSKQIAVKESNDPLHEPRAMLQRYVAGQPPASEVSSYPAMIEHVRKTDPARADILQTGLADIQKASGSARVAKAKELLDKLKPSMTAAPAATPAGPEPAAKPAS